jgi:hypothetical protein
VHRAPAIASNTARSACWDDWTVAEAKARPELGSVSDAIVSWDTAGDQTQPCDIALGPLLDYVRKGSR